MTQTASNPRLRVLVVDDEMLIRWSVVETLAGRGHEVHEAHDARSALDALEEAPEPFDVALVDLRLPDSTDLSLLQKIKRMVPSMAIVMMTAFGTPDIIAGARELGAYDVVSKPFDVHGIERLLINAYHGRAH